MELYAKFMKELLSKKRLLKKDLIVVMTKESSKIIQGDMPKKLKDLVSFQIPCTIGTTTLEKALCDLGTSINLMPLSMMKKLQIKEMKPTRIALQMEDRLVKFAHGVVENILVKVEKFFLPVDFVILDIEEVEDASIIFGRPFLAIRRALIDVEKGELTLRVHKKHMVFNVFKDILHPSEGKSCMKINLINPAPQDEKATTHSLEVSCLCLEAKEDLAMGRLVEDTIIKDRHNTNKNEDERGRAPVKLKMEFSPPIPKPISLGTNKAPPVIKHASLRKDEGIHMKKIKR
ncbi:uncharacterized protein LOC107607345 [Arachis ipaensis]|uniref:uncharacterized protein LOC107607345 n=1 Tax=Arachis ipaensis TaxID=130454 RepID=UPI0007AF5ED8|nr:uncharacterized protein LOC107607345 [Arachis ipaensis]